MDRLRALRTFVAVADHASFAEAGRLLAVSPTVVSRTIAALEQAAGVQLLVRTTRSVRLTAEGRAFLDQTRAGLAELDAAFATARGGVSEPQGSLTVTAPVMFGRLHIAPIVFELLQRHPKLDVRLLLLDRMVSLVDEGIDIGVRIAELSDSALHARRIASVRRILTASPAYVATAGHPDGRSGLKSHRLVVVENEAGHGAVGTIRGVGQPRLVVNSVETAIDAAAAGLGIIETLSYQVAARIAAGSLVRVLADEPSPELPVSLLFQGGRGGTPNVRAFVDLARERLGGAAL